MVSFLSLMLIFTGIVLFVFSLFGLFVFIDEEDRSDSLGFLVLVFLSFLISIGLLFFGIRGLNANSTEYNKNLVRPCIQEYYKPVNEMRYDCYKIFESTRGVREIVEELKNE